MKSGSSIGISMVQRLVRAMVGRAGGVDALEPRSLLAGTPLPTLAMLENADHPVVRMETTYGDVDIELFSGTNPLTVANFLNYVRAGKMDETFFHRKTTNSVDGIAVLQGGGFLYDNGEGARAIDTDPPVNLEIGTGRSNVARTISMARTQAVNSGTNQFFFNMDDNSADLDPQGTNAGYAVFGRVIQGWDNVLAAWNRPATDLDDDPAFVGTDLRGALPAVPTTADYNTTAGVRENSLVELSNIDIIKPQGIAGLFTHRSVMPEGFNSDSSVEWVDLFNPNGFAVQYQLVARYEADGDTVNFAAGEREKVIASGTLNATTSLRVSISGAGAELTLAGRGYALVLETAAPEAQTTARGVAAALTRVDFGGQEASESFINPALYTAAQLKDWSFARLERNTGSREFITLYNLSDQTATVTLDVLTPDGVRRETRVIEAYRRSGLATGIGTTFAEGVLSVRVRSNQNIVAVASDWSTTPTGPGDMVRGTAGGGATNGAVAGVLNGAGRTSTISVSNQGTTATVVTFSVWRSGASTSIDSTQVVLPGTRSDFALSSLASGLNDGERVAVTYDSGTVPVTVQYLTEGTGDAGAAAFATHMGAAAHFAQGRVSGNANLALAAEVVSIFNPFPASGTALNWTVTFTFSDGTVLTGATGSLLSRERVDVATLSDSATASLTSGATQVSAEVRAKIASLFTGTGTRGGYGITVTGTLVNLPPPQGTGAPLSLPASGIAQLSRYMVDSTGAVVLDTGAASDSDFTLPATIPT